MFTVQFTAGRVDLDENPFDGGYSDSGWVNPMNLRIILDVFEEADSEEFDTKKEALEYIESTIGSVDIENSNGQTYYALDGDDDMQGSIYYYAGHITEQ